MQSIYRSKQFWPRASLIIGYNDMRQAFESDNYRESLAFNIRQTQYVYLKSATLFDYRYRKKRLAEQLQCAFRLVIFILRKVRV